AEAEPEPLVQAPPPLAGEPEAEVAPSRPPRRLEEYLGARGFIWLGGIALALAGVFLVKYSIDQGLLGPGVRVVPGLLLGAGLRAGGEVTRRRDGRIAQALSAAGVAVLFAALYAATSLYGFLSPTQGFIVMALMAGAAIALSLRQGPFVALLGL